MARFVTTTLIFLMSLSLSLVMSGCSEDPEPKSVVPADTTDSGAKSCGEKTSCIDDKGKSDLTLCPTPVDYKCVSGCCEKIEKCSNDDDCAVKLGTSVCPDKRYLCACGTDGGCQQAVCATDKDCPAGKFCNNGGCHDAPKGADLEARLLRPYWVARPGDTLEPVAGLGAQARTADGAVSIAAKFQWKLDGEGFKLDGGKLVATDKAGTAQLSATIEGGAKASNPASLWNLGPIGKAKLRVAVADDATLAPLTGKVVAIGMADQATPAKAQVVQLAVGVATFDAIDFPVDVHVIADGHETVSVLRLAGSKGSADILVPARLHHFADLAYDAAGKMLDDSKLIAGDVINGKVKYIGAGEAGLGITSLGVGGDLLNFNIDALVGPSVKRPFDDKAPKLVNPEPGKPQDIPGGVTFLLQQPVVNGYVLASPPGKRILWSLAGRVPLSDLGPAISSIVGAVDGGLDIGKVVGALLPYLSSFYSQVITDVTFSDKLTKPAQSKDLAPDVPLGLMTTIEAAGLPKVKDGQWADLVLSLAGAMMPDGQFVPLGLTAGPDAADGAVADGKVDGDPVEKGDQPMSLRFAPLHSGLRVGKQANFVQVHAAVNVGGDDKREGGSIVISDVGPVAAKSKTGEFMAYASASTYDAGKRTLTVQPVDGAHLYRAIFTASEGKRWVVVVPVEAAGKTLTVADLSEWGAAADLGKSPKRVFISALELRNKLDTDGLLSPGGLDDLVRQVKRTSFIDVH